MAGCLPMQVVDHELEASLLHVGSHPTAHRAQSDESYHPVVLRHHSRSLRFLIFVRHRRLAVRPTLRKASRPRKRDASSRHPWVMSALPPKADVNRRGTHVRLVPKADIRIAAKSISHYELGISLWS